MDVVASDKISTKSDKAELDPEEYVLRKRLPRRLPKRPNDVYITLKTNFNGQLARCHKLLESGKHDVIYIHGLGAAVDRAMNIALQLKATSRGGISPLEVSANTSTVDLVDDLEPVDDFHEPKTQSRRASAIHIKVFRSENGAIANSASSSSISAGASATSSGKKDETIAAANVKRVDLKLSKLTDQTKKSATERDAKMDRNLQQQHHSEDVSSPSDSSKKKRKTQQAIKPQ